MDSKLVGLSIAAAIVIILAGAVLMPIIDDAVDDTKVYYNNDFGVMSAAANDTIEYSIEPTGNSSGAISLCYINGEKVATVYNGIRAIVLADSFSISQVNNTSEYFIAVGKSTESMLYRAIMAEGITIDMDSSQSVISFVTSDGSQTIEISTEWCYYRDDNSTDYRIVDYQSTDHKAYINDPSQVRGSFWSGVTNSFVSFDGSTASVYGEYAQTVPVSLSGYAKEMNGVYSFDVGLISGGNRSEGAQFEVMVNNNPVTITSYFLVIPNEVYGQTESDISYSTLLYVIPALLIIAVLVMIISRSIRS